MKGILLAGGIGSRLWPMTQATSKQLLPVYDKPAIYYPLSTLMDLDIQDILVISSVRDLPAIRNLLGNGLEFGVKINYLEQSEPKGIAEALIIGSDFLGDDNCTLILGDNLFFGIDNNENRKLQNSHGAHVLVYKVPDPTSYGNIELGIEGRVLQIVEKPKIPISPYAVTGLYILDGKAKILAKSLKPSPRGELEITDLLNIYRKDEELTALVIQDGAVWMDMGTISTITIASEYVRIIQERQGVLIGSPHLIGLEKGWISKSQLESMISPFSSQYAVSLKNQLPRFS
jgi:glucose-1-phosphate thymidylyltransferase